MSEKKERGAVAITGAGRGIGAAIALELARRGHTVACLTRAGKGIEDAPVPAALAPSILAEPCDVTDEGSVEKALRATAGRAGGLSGLVNNAGVHSFGPSAELTTEELERVFATNVSGLFNACRAAYPLLRERGGGTIVNLGSFFDRMGVPQNLAYTASKAAVGAITRCLAVEWAAERVVVLNVAPGYVQTDLNRQFLKSDRARRSVLPRIPVGRAGKPEEVARLVAALFGEKLGYLTGETIYLDGGQGINH